MAISFAGVLLLIVLLVVFRSSVKRANEILPEAVNHTLNAAAKGCDQLERIVTVNCLESDVELNARVQDVLSAIEADGGLQDINAVYNQVHGVQAKTNRRQVTAVNTAAQSA